MMQCQQRLVFFTMNVVGRATKGRKRQQMLSNITSNKD